MLHFIPGFTRIDTACCWYIRHDRQWHSKWKGDHRWAISNPASVIYAGSHTSDSSKRISPLRHMSRVSSDGFISHSATDGHGCDTQPGWYTIRHGGCATSHSHILRSLDAFLHQVPRQARVLPCSTGFSNKIMARNFFTVENKNSFLSVNLFLYTWRTRRQILCNFLIPVYSDFFLCVKLRIM